VKFNLKTPCAECPFRRDVHPYLTKGRAEEIASAVLHEDRTFACHKTVYPANKGHRRVRPEGHSMCVGAILLIEAAAPFGNQMLQIAERLGLYDPATVRRDRDVAWSTEAEFVNHHGGA
jgi:hypothetical protein